VRADDWKLIEHFEDGRLRLFNLRDDIGEQHDLAARHPETTRRLHELLRVWRAEVGALVPRPNERWMAPAND
jgi:hypothetical protein